MSFEIAVLKGDGIGPEVTDQSLKVLLNVASKYGISFDFTDGLIGGFAYDKTGTPLPQETIDLCKKSDAVLLGAVGGPKWDKAPNDKRPEMGLLSIRKMLGLYANIRPAILIPALKTECPLKDEIINNGINITVVRELTGGIYFGEKGREIGANGIEAYDINKYNEMEIRRIANVAFALASKRNKKIVSIDKANVLESSKLWRSVVEEVSKSFSDVKLCHMYVDNAAMQLVKNPAQFDIILTDNMFGDILSDEAAQITGSIGILPSASLGDGTLGLYEPIHGSAPDIAGKNVANPIASILSAAMMVRISLGLEEVAKSIENAVNITLEQGYRTQDLDNENYISCSKMGDIISQNIV
ncbi:MAG: 3-isopropylmalate dehydrogenase [Eubacteriales bacterium]|nr:3-isopropylmalate dehydrogenase [Eubacteriales bacterium]